MPDGNPDTIVAAASAVGRAAVGIIRLSGSGVQRIAASILGALPAPRVACLRCFKDDHGDTLDQGIAVYFPAPGSFTGEDVLEMQGHGGALVMDGLLRRVLALGARLARPGEFSERAFLNGKLDVAQAEAVADLIDAATTTAARAAVRSMRGEFSTHIRNLQSQITELRVHVEAAIDFPDEQIDFLTRADLQGRLSRVFAAFDAITAAARQGVLLREGLTVVIAGKPNAGKSSLLNRLVGEDVAIVTDLPGTTRDVLRQQVNLDGLPLNLSDTAGLRSAADIVEEEGIRRAKAEMQRADRVLYVLDAASSEHVPAARLEGVPLDTRVTIVINKIDLIGAAASADEDADPPRIHLSARTGEGMELLRTHLKKCAGYHDASSGTYSARRRHLDALRRAALTVRQAADALHDTQALELFAEDLRLAQQALSEITGHFSNEDLLAEIFGSFCIGK